MDSDMNVSTNGAEPVAVTSEHRSVEDQERIYMSSDWRTSCSGTPLADLTNEPIHVQAAYKVLEKMHCQTYLGFFVGQADRRLACAREMGAIHKAIEDMLTSNTFRPL